MKNQGPARRNSQAGSIFVWIFVMIALFAAVSYSMSQSLRGGSTTITRDKARIAATEIVSFANSVQTGVRQLLISGCTDETISFQSEWNKDTGVQTGNAKKVYDNTDSPQDKTCHLFYPAGAGLNDIKAPENAVDNGLSIPDTYRDSGQYFYAGGVTFDETTTGDLTLWLPHVKKEVCEELNRLLNIGPKHQVAGLSVNALWPFSGEASYFNWSSVGTATDSSDLSGKKMGCIEITAGTNSATSLGGYAFYTVLIARK